MIPPEKVSGRCWRIAAFTKPYPPDQWKVERDTRTLLNERADARPDRSEVARTRALDGWLPRSKRVAPGGPRLPSPSPAARARGRWSSWLHGADRRRHGACGDKVQCHRKDCTAPHDPQPRLNQTPRLLDVNFVNPSMRSATPRNANALLTARWPTVRYPRRTGAPAKPVMPTIGPACDVGGPGTPGRWQETRFEGGVFVRHGPA